MMFDQSWKHLYVLIESILPKAFTQLQIAIELAYKIVDEFEFLQCIEINLHMICLTL